MRGLEESLPRGSWRGGMTAASEIASKACIENIDRFYGRIVLKGPKVTKTKEGVYSLEAGWDVPTTLHGEILFACNIDIKSARIEVAFCGYTETRWEGYSNIRLAAQNESAGYKVSRVGTLFQNVSSVAFEGPDPLLASAVTTTFWEPTHWFTSTTVDTAVPLLLAIPESTRARVLASLTPQTHTVDSTPTTVGYILHAPTITLAAGDTLELHLALTSTPGAARLRRLRAHVSPVAAFLNNEAVVRRATFPEPVGVVEQDLPRIRVAPGEEAVSRRIKLPLPAERAMASFEALLISVRTIVRVEIETDDENVTVAEFPILVWPALGSSEGGKVARMGKGKAMQSNATIDHMKWPANSILSRDGSLHI
ncbi:hypothetical protein BC830DRAFT_1079576 [Chytriomyces sp. MP71]|nr:hypothetical protein BC830DRAFT_1079576 [Chytriomyces sp. MP71]